MSGPLPVQRGVPPPPKPGDTGLEREREREKREGRYNVLILTVSRQQPRGEQ